MTYTELTNLIKNFCDSTETTFVNTIADFVKNAEERIFELVQFDFFRKSVSGNLTAGNRFLTAPSDYIASFSLAVIDSSGDYHYLLKKHPSFMQEYSEDPTDTNLRGLPLYYAEYDKELSTGSDNGSTLTVSPVPDSAYNVELNYLHKPQSLTSATTGTWLSTNARNALLYASLVEAYTFLKGEPELIGQYEKRFMEELSRLKNRAEGRSRRDEYRADSLRTNVT
jgi:hypothetical protein